MYIYCLSFLSNYEAYLSSAPARELYVEMHHFVSSAIMKGDWTIVGV